jgi:hypothetical protein
VKRGYGTANPLDTGMFFVAFKGEEMYDFTAGDWDTAPGEVAYTDFQTAATQIGTTDTFTAMLPADLDFYQLRRPVGNTPATDESPFTGHPYMLVDETGTPSDEEDQIDSLTFEVTATNTDDPVTGVTIGIVRRDTSAQVVANGTAMVLAEALTGGGRYTYALDGSDLTHPEPIAGVTYRATYVVTRTSGATTSSVFDKTEGDGETEWYYSDRAGVATLIDAANIAIVWDMDNDGAEDDGLLVADGVQADGYIDLFLANEGLTVPIVLADQPAYVTQALADASNHMVCWYGWHHRGLQELAQLTGRPADDIAGMMSGYKKYADAQLAKIASVMTSTDDDGEFEAPFIAQTTPVCGRSVFQPMFPLRPNL